MLAVATHQAQLMPVLPVLPVLPANGIPMRGCIRVSRVPRSPCLDDHDAQLSVARVPTNVHLGDATSHLGGLHTPPPAHASRRACFFCGNGDVTGDQQCCAKHRERHACVAERVAGRRAGSVLGRSYGRAHHAPLARTPGSRSVFFLGTEHVHEGSRRTGIGRAYSNHDPSLLSNPTHRQALSVCPFQLHHRPTSKLP